MIIKIGMLGGGQLGQMFLQNAYFYPFEVHVLDPDPEAPCSQISPHFSVGSIQEYASVYAFGKDKDIITVEIEAVNTEALKALEREGKRVFPQPHIIELIADKRLQKQFFRDNDLPTSDFITLNKKEDLTRHAHFLPAFQKVARGGYDGKGVQLLQTPEDFGKAFEGESLLEKKVDIDKEIAVIVARNHTGVSVYEPVEMIFDKKLHLVDYLLAPARLTAKQVMHAQKIAQDLIEKLEMVGILAVEMFLDTQGNILINEIAPRPHNSGHHSIEACFSSQFDAHLRAIAGLPLAHVQLHHYAGMLNIIGEQTYEGVPHYIGLAESLGMENVFLHLYNKKITKAGRKMGHFTILGNEYAEIEEKIQQLKSTFKVISHI